MRLVETEAASAPATWGAFRPVVALPAGFEAWPRDGLVAVLVHELAHVRRRDALARLGADLCRTLLWFHPAVWFARRKLHAECERACDDAVLAAGTTGVRYAETLLAVAREVPVSARAAMTMSDARDLEGRMRATAVAAMRLVERGELDLDVTIQRYVPSFRLPHPRRRGRVRRGPRPGSSRGLLRVRGRVSWTGASTSSREDPP